MDGRRVALVVAVDEYEHPGLRRLRSPAADAEALGAVLADPGVAGFEVKVSRNEAAHEVQARIEDLFADARADDVVLLHFSGHGLKSEAGELYLAARATRPDRLASTAVAADFVQRCMRSSASRSIVLLLDCCYGGAFGEGVTVRAGEDVYLLDSFPTGRLGGGRGRAVISASNAMEYAFEAGRLRGDALPEPSPFTAALVRGLATGEADRDEDGWVSLNELYDYVFDRVRAQNPNQTPTRDIEMQGELYLARSTRRRIAPAALPADLQAALDDTNPYTRLGAVAELRSRLLSENLPVAAGAQVALARVAEADTRVVGEAATEALRLLHLVVTPESLAFGPLPAGTSSAPHRLEPAGAPLVRGAAATSSQDWIRVAPSAGGWDVVVVPPAPGRAEGAVTLAAPGRTVVVPVTVEGVAPVPVPASRTTPVRQQPVREDRVPKEFLRAHPVPHQPVPQEPAGGVVAPRGARDVGLLCILAAGPPAVGLLVWGLQQQDGLGLFYLLHPAALVAAGVLLVAGRRSATALGVAAAAGTAATWPLAVVVALVAGDVVGDRTLPSLLLAALVLCVAAGGSAALVARREAGLRLHPSAVGAPARALVVAVAVVASGALLLNADRFADHDVGSWAWLRLPFLWYGLPALVLPLAAAFAVPAGVRAGLRLGWVAAAVPFHVVFFATATRVDSAYFTYAGLVVYAALLPVLVAATMWRPRPR